jgi:hypothetical protein
VRRHATSHRRGCSVEDEPDFAEADETFQTLRAWSFAQSAARTSDITAT